MVQPTLIVSDLHLGAVSEAVRQAFIRFTREWHGRVETLLINGDLFDFWCEYRTVFPSLHFHTLRALADLRESGVKLILVGGNHDAWGGRFLESEVGIELADGPIELELAGRRALVAHGDGLGPGDMGYKILRRVLRSRPMCGLMRWVHPDVTCRIAQGVSRTSERTERGFDAARERAQVLEDYAADTLRERDDIELVVFGHCHTPQVKQVGSHGYYINSGDWVTHRTYTVVTAETIEQREWEDG
jgi:UDP-2,3-diacylglucosamine hydrolase